MFQINKISYQNWSDRSTRGIVKHVYILAVCPYNVCDVLPCQLTMAMDHAWKNTERSLRYHVKRELPRHKQLWTNKLCHNPLFIEILMIYWIINLHIHMHFFRYLDFYTIHSGVSFPLIVLIHVTWIVYKHPFSYQWLYFLLTLYRIC